MAYTLSEIVNNDDIFLTLKEAMRAEEVICQEKEDELKEEEKLLKRVVKREGELEYEKAVKSVILALAGSFRPLVNIKLCNESLSKYTFIGQDEFTFIQLVKESGFYSLYESLYRPNIFFPSLVTRDKNIFSFERYSYDKSNTVSLQFGYHYIFLRKVNIGWRAKQSYKITFPTKNVISLRVCIIKLVLFTLKPP